MLWLIGKNSHVLSVVLIYMKLVISGRFPYPPSLGYMDTVQTIVNDPPPALPEADNFSEHFGSFLQTWYFIVSRWFVYSNVSYLGMYID